MKNIKLTGYQNYSVNVEVRMTIFGKLWQGNNAFLPVTINVNQMRERMSDRSLTIGDAIEYYLMYETGDFQKPVSIIQCTVQLEYTQSNQNKVGSSWFKRMYRTIDLSMYKPLQEYWATDEQKEAYEEVWNNVFEND